MAWDYRKYGTATDPIHKSHLNDICGDYGCPRQFRYRMDERAAGVDHESTIVSGKAALGTAAHETIARALSNPETVERILTTRNAFTINDVQRVFDVELAREIGGRETNWRDDSAADLSLDRTQMITKLFADLHNHVHSIELVEAGFVVKIGSYWLSGHVDLVYRPKSNPNAFGLADWKTGATKPHQLALDHGWEAGIYSAAIASGAFIKREQLETGQFAGKTWIVSCGTARGIHASKYIAERECLESALCTVARSIDTGESALPVPVTNLFGFPEEIHHVHLADYVPYKKAGKKEIKRPEDLRWYNMERPGPRAYVAGERRGPAWLPVHRTEHDVPRLAARLRNIVGMIRMGWFVDQIGEKCARCAFAGPCLNSGYAPRGDEAKEIERALHGLDLGD